MWTEQKEKRINCITYILENIEPTQLGVYLSEIKEEILCKGQEIKVQSFQSCDEKAAAMSFLQDENAMKNTIVVTNSPFFASFCKEEKLCCLQVLADENCFDGIVCDYVVTKLQAANLSYIIQIYERYHQIPWKILETERLLLREITVDDLKELYEVYADPGISLYTENLYEDYEKEYAYTLDYIHHVYEFYGFGVWLLIEKESGKIIGRAGLSMRDGFEEPELGYVVAVPYQRKGFAYEACQGILQYAKEELYIEKIRVLFDPENTASEKLCQKLGFRFHRKLMIEGKEMVQYRND